MRAGRLDSRVRFDLRAITSDDGFGNVETDWAERLTVWAGFRPEFGREKVAAGRLESTLRGTLTVRRSPSSEAITTADRAVFVSGAYVGHEMQVRSIVPTPDRASIEMTLEAGVAT